MRGMTRNVAVLVMPQPFLVYAAWTGRGPAAAAALAIWGALSAVVVLGLLRPRSRMFGPNLWRGEPQPRVALTFDDGPHPEDTPAILDILRQADARATFFFVGRRARRYPELVRRASAEGHGIGAHSDTHPWWFSLSLPGRIRREVQDSVATLEALARRRPRYFRPPMGHKNVFLSSEVAAAGLETVTWSVRSYDTVRREPAKIAALVDRAEPGGIILLHEGTRRGPGRSSATVDALASIIAGLRARGLDPVSLEDLQAAPATPGSEVSSSGARGR